MRANLVPHRNLLLSAALIMFLVLCGISPSAAQTCLPPPSGLSHWWPGDGNANDIAGTNHGTLQGGASFAPGTVGQAFSLDGMDDRIDLASPVSPVGSLTVEGWVNPASFGSFAIINRLTVMHADNGAPVFGFGILSDINGSLARRVDFVARDSATNALAVRSNSQLTVGVPAHVAWTWDAATRTANVYVNGTFETSGSNANIDLSSLPSLLAIGATTRGTTVVIDHFHGLIDELTVYNRVLAASEIGAIHAAGSAGKCKATQTTYACVGFAAPFDQPIRLSARANRAIPLEMQLTSNGLPVTDATIDGAPPVVNVNYAPAIGPAVDVTNQLEPIGQASEGNQFTFDASTDQWVFKLGTRPFKAAGTYTVTVAPGDMSYTISPTCTGQFVRSD